MMVSIVDLKPFVALKTQTSTIKEFGAAMDSLKQMVAHPLQLRKCIPAAHGY